MRTIATIALATVLAACSFVADVEAAAPRWNQLDGYTFEQWKRDFSRQYPSPAEEEYRRGIFYRKLSEVKAHNEKQGVTYRKGVNQFSDWSAEEFKSYNTHRKMTDVEQGGFNLPIQGFSATGAIIPGAVDHRRASPPVLTGVKNQGHCGSCWAHSTVESIESYFAIRFGQLPVLSQQQVTSCTTQMFGCGGGNAAYGWNYVHNSKGLYEEWEYPYTAFFAANMSKAATAKCVDVAAENFPNWSWAPKANVTAMWAVDTNNATATMEALALHGPLSISVGAADWSDYEGGIFTNPPGSNIPWEIDHAVQMVGYGHDIDMDMDYWIVRNSWGTTWGESGFIRLYRTNSPANEPCGTAEGQQSCGTSGCLNGPAFPDVAELAVIN